MTLETLLEESRQMGYLVCDRHNDPEREYTLNECVLCREDFARRCIAFGMRKCMARDELTCREARRAMFACSKAIEEGKLP